MKTGIEEPARFEVRADNGQRYVRIERTPVTAHNPLATGETQWIPGVPDYCTFTVLSVNTLADGTFEILDSVEVIAGRVYQPADSLLSLNSRGHRRRIKTRLALRSACQRIGPAASVLGDQLDRMRLALALGPFRSP